MQQPFQGIMQQSIQGSPIIMQQPIQGTAAPTVYVMADREQKETLFAKKAAKPLSIAQIILGQISILCQVIYIILLHTNPYVARDGYYYNNDHIAGVGEGIYCGIFFIIAGFLGILASRKPSTYSISAFMILSIFASLFSAILIIIGSIHIAVVSVQHRIEVPGPKIAMFSIMVLSGLVEGVVSIICAAICCRAWCCSGGEAMGRVVYLAQGHDGSGATTVQMEGGFPVEMAYIPQPMPATEALGQNMNKFPTYVDEVKEKQEVEGKEKFGEGRYKRFRGCSNMTSAIFVPL